LSWVREFKRKMCCLCNFFPK